MKTISARATYSDKARKLFSTAGRETVRGILAERSEESGQFVVRGTVVRTYKTPVLIQSKKKK